MHCTIIVIVIHLERVSTHTHVLDELEVSHC